MGNERYDEIDTDFDPSNDIFTKHILGLSYNQRLVNDRWQNSFFVKNYTNYLNVTQQDLPWITGSREKQGASTKNYTGYEDSPVGRQPAIAHLIEIGRASCRERV